MAQLTRKKMIGRLVILPLLAALLVALITFSFSSEYGIINVYKTYKEQKRLQNEITQMHTVVDSLHNEIYRLQHDTAYIEKFAREKLGMTRGEKVYKFVEEKD
ncbi:MAG: hypothetical protein GF398_21760 [Chitinivibrionales bacterium]|nr:hypothetical protein [Chitinivibrionales bacterium]